MYPGMLCIIFGIVLVVVGIGKCLQWGLSFATANIITACSLFFTIPGLLFMIFGILCILLYKISVVDEE